MRTVLEAKNSGHAPAPGVAERESERHPDSLDRHDTKSLEPCPESGFTLQSRIVTLTGQTVGADYRTRNVLSTITRQKD